MGHSRLEILAGLIVGAVTAWLVDLTELWLNDSMGTLS
jgi:acid phosphatase family membrane protein YuiD